jgi:hypothetical protein
MSESMGRKFKAKIGGHLVHYVVTEDLEGNVSELFVDRRRYDYVRNEICLDKSMEISCRLREASLSDIIGDYLNEDRQLEVNADILNGAIVYCHDEVDFAMRVLGIVYLGKTELADHPERLMEGDDWSVLKVALEPSQAYLDARDKLIKGIKEEIDVVDLLDLADEINDCPSQHHPNPED